MSKTQEIAELYFQLSNKSDFEGIAKLFTDFTTYRSQTTGLYLGSHEILEMQKSFHGKFSSLNWEVKSVKELKPGIENMVSKALTTFTISFLTSGLKP